MTVSIDLPPQASDASLAVYVHAIRHGGITVGAPGLPEELGLAAEVVEASVDQLIQLRLLRRESGAGWWRLVPVSPEVAAASLISPIGAEIHRQRVVISQIQSRLTVFQPHYEAHREANREKAAGTGIESISDATELSGQLHLAAERCQRDLLGFRPQGLLSLKHIASISAHGVSVRLLLSHTLRTDLRVRPILRDIVASGGLVRTTGRPTLPVIIFDDVVAFLVGGEEPGPAGVIIRHEETVRLLRDVVETTWAAAEPYATASIGYQQVTDDLQRTIVELLASGLTDEVIARRLGISVRTCRRHIATVLSTLAAVSRFQAGALAASTGLLDANRLHAGGAPPTGSALSRSALSHTRPAPAPSSGPTRG
jgi:DNA-binding CsgD family transcriptional regulator